MNIIKNTNDTIEVKKEHIGRLIGGVVYNTISEIEKESKDRIELGIDCENVKEIKTKYDSKGEKTTFIASAHAAYEISQKIRRNSLIEFLIDKLSMDELDQLNTLVSLTDISITDEA